MTDKAIGEPEDKTYYLCVTSNKAPMPIGTMLRANRKEKGHYWFDEEMDVLNPVHGSVAMPIHWFSEITNDSNVAVAIGKIKDEFEALENKFTEEVNLLTDTIKTLQEDVKLLQDSGTGGSAPLYGEVYISRDEGNFAKAGSDRQIFVEKVPQLTEITVIGEEDE